MGKLIRYVGFGVLALVLLIVIAAVVLPMIIDPNDFKGQIAQAVETHTGRQLAMEGDLELSVFPWLGVEIGDTALANAPGFSERPFARVDTVQVKVKLLPLLRKQLEMDTVVLKGLRLSLETDASGNTNWADLGGDAEADAPPKPDEPGGMALAGLAVGGVEISDAALIWDDKQTPARYEIENIELETGAIAPGESVPVRLRLQLASSEPEISGPLEFKATVGLSEDGKRVRLQDADLEADLAGDGLPGGALSAELGFATSVDLEKQTLAVTDLVLQIFGLKAEGGLTGENILGDAATFNGQLALREFVPREVIKSLGVELPETSDPQVLGKADAQLKLAATMDSLSVPDLRVRLDDSALQGNLKVSNFAKPAIRFNLQLDSIDVDRYLPPSAEEPAPVTPTAAAAAGTQLIPVETLRALDVNGKVVIKTLKAAQLRSTDIVMQLVANDGLVRIHPASARLYEGQYQGDISLDVRGQQPKIAMNERLSGVQVGPLLKDMTGQDRLTGATEASALLTANGQTPDALKQSLNGKLAFAFKQGAVKGFNLAALLRQAQARINGTPAPAESGASQTDFSEMTGTATVTNGVVRNQDLVAKSPLLRVEGKGSVDLVAETLDYLVTAKVVGSLEGAGGKELTQLRGVAIPVQLGGTFDEPSYAIRMDEALRGVAEEKVKEKVKEQEEKVKEKLQEKLEKKFGDSLKGLF